MSVRHIQKRKYEKRKTDIGVTVNPLNIQI